MLGLHDLSWRRASVRADRFLRDIKEEIAEGRPDSVTRRLRNQASLLGGRAVVSVLVEIVRGRMNDSVSHHDASTQLSQLAHTLDNKPLNATTWFTLENISRAIGCFHASHQFTRRGLHQLSHQPIHNDHDRTRQFLAHLHQRNLTAAEHTWTTRTPTPHTKDFWKDAGHYLWLWSNHHTGTPHWSTDTHWTHTLRGHPITILGPAPTSLTPTHLTPTTLTARVIAPGVVSWPSDDVAGGRCDLAWANSSSTKWFAEHSQQEALARFQVTSFRTATWRQMGIANGRTAAHHKRLLPVPWDKTNMVPLMVWDILRVPDVELTVAGTTFFASQTAYSPHERRFKQDRQVATDQTGSTGLRLERCLSFSSHGLSAHHTLMALIMHAGAVAFDDEGHRVLELSTEDYLAEIDRLYGEPAR
jgi:hypothetical protein